MKRISKIQQELVECVKKRELLRHSILQNCIE